ncbi:ANK3, partial [Symbiodinium sp. CCMP2592]
MTRCLVPRKLDPAKSGLCSLSWAILLPLVTLCSASIFSGWPPVTPSPMQGRMLRREEAEAAVDVLGLQAFERTWDRVKPCLEAQAHSAAVPSFLQRLYRQSLRWISHPQHWPWLWLILAVSVVTLAPVGILRCRDACLGKSEESSLQWEEAILGLSEAEACAFRLVELISGIYVARTYFAGGIWWFGGLLAFVKLFSLFSLIVALPPKRLCMAFVLQLGFAAHATNSAFFFLQEGEGKVELPRTALWLWRLTDMGSRVIFWIVACMVLDPDARPCIPFIFLCELAACVLYWRRCLQPSLQELKDEGWPRPARSHPGTPNSDARYQMEPHQRNTERSIGFSLLCLCGMPWPCFPADLCAQLRLQLCATLWRSNLVIFFVIVMVHRYATVTHGACSLAAEPVLEILMSVGLTMHLLAMLGVLIYQALLRTRCLCLFPTRAVFGDSRLHLAVGLGAEHLVQEFWTADEEDSLLREAVFAGHGGVIEVLHAQGQDVCTAETRLGVASHLAARAGKVDVLRALQKLGADMRSTDEDGSNAALLASRGGHGAALQLLLQARCDPEARNPLGDSAVIVATRNGRAALLPMLLETRCDPQTVGRDGEPLILTAAALQTTDSLQALLEARCDPTVASKDGDTPVLRAASRGSIGVLKLLLEVRSDPSIANKRGNTPVIITAAMDARTDELKLLLAARCDPTLTNKKGGSAVGSAVTNGNIGGLALLLAARCDPSIADKSGNTPIIAAAEKGSIDTLKLLLEAKGDPSMVNNDGSSAIIKATGHEQAGLGAVAALTLLLEARCDPSFADKNGETPAIIAARHESTDALSLLLEAKCDPKMVSKDGGSAVLEAAARKSADALKMLLEARCDPSMADKAGNTPVIIAAGNDCIDALKLLLEARANPRITNKDGSGAIIKAAATGHVDSLELLLEARCDPGMADEDGNTPIIAAAGKGRTGFVKLLLEARGDPRILNKHGQSAVFEAARRRDAESLRLLLEARCDPHSVDEDGFTAIMAAAGTGVVDALNLLLEARCDAESADHLFGFTPVSFAAMGGWVDALEILLRARCDPRKAASRAVFCESAATIAARTGKTEALKTLLRARCDPEAVNITGDTAVMLAVREGHPATLQFLVHEGCNLKARNKDGDTAVSLAAAVGEAGMLQLLLESRCELDLRTAGSKNSVDEASRVMDKAMQWLLGASSLVDRTDVTLANSHGEDGQHVGRLTFSSAEALTLAYHRRKLGKQMMDASALPVLRGHLRGLTVLLPRNFAPSARDSSFILLTCGVPEVARSSGKLYHEVELLSTTEAAQLGWLTTRFDAGAKTAGFGPPKSVGIDAEGWAFDAQRAAQWHNKRQKEANMDRWRPDDRLGLAIDMDEGTMRISDRDGSWRKEAAYHMSFQKGDRML